MINLIKDLRERTGAPIGDCKKAIEATNGDINEAIKWLRENGIAKAAKKGDRIASEGITYTKLQGNKAIIFELNSETDFVAQNEKFLNLVEKIGDIIIQSDAKNLENVLQIDVNGSSLAEMINSEAAIIGEKLMLRRVAVIEKTDNENFAEYIHMGGKITAILKYEGDNTERAAQIAQHIVAANPKYLDASEVDQNVIEEERQILTKEAISEGKPEEIAHKMVEGRVRKFLEEISLNDQKYVFDNNIRIADFAKDGNIKLLQFYRYEVGEGIEKKEENFAEEVMKQLNK